MKRIIIVHEKNTTPCSQPVLRRAVLGGRRPPRALLVELTALRGGCHGGLRCRRLVPLHRLEVHLRQGGFVIYFRHADSGPASPDPPGVDLSRGETQRNLNDKGRAEATAIGRQFQRLGIPVGAVRSSRFCRCWQTAQLAFGRYELDPLLTGVPRAPEHDAARRAASDALRKALGTVPGEASEHRARLARL